MTMTASRHRLPWSMSETNRLYSEYEMKKLDISKIAQLHSRTEYAILHKLAQECMINASWNDVKGWKNAPKEMTQFKVMDDYDEDYEEEDHDSDSDYEDDDHDSDSDYEEDDHDSDSDYEECEDCEEYEKESVISEESLDDYDDPNDSDYVDEEDDCDNSSDYEDENDKEFDAYSIPEKVSTFKKLVDAARFFIYNA